MDAGLIRRSEGDGYVPSCSSGGRGLSLSLSGGCVVTVHLVVAVHPACGEVGSGCNGGGSEGGQE